jgi:hypothetical protein
VYVIFSYSENDDGIKRNKISETCKPDDETNTIRRARNIQRNYIKLQANRVYTCPNRLHVSLRGYCNMAEAHTRYNFQYPTLIIASSVQSPAEYH